MFVQEVRRREESGELLGGHGNDHVVNETLLSSRNLEIE